MIRSLFLLALFLSACGYESSYVPGEYFSSIRARPLWRNNEIVAYIPPLADRDTCLGAIAKLTQTRTIYSAAGDVSMLPGTLDAVDIEFPKPGHWHPNDYGLGVYADHSGLLPAVLSQPAYYWIERAAHSAELFSQQIAKALDLHYHIESLTIPKLPTGTVRSHLSIKLKGGGGGRDSSKDTGKQWTDLASASLVMILTMPAITITLISWPAGTTKKSAQAIDQVNSFNDLYRNRADLSLCALSNQHKD